MVTPVCFMFFKSDMFILNFFSKLSMKHVFIFLVMVALAIILNDLYFEICISRELPTGLVRLATILIVVLDVAFIAQAVKSLIKLLKL